MLGLSGFAQTATISTTHTANNGAGLVLFAVKNTNTTSIFITDISCALGNAAPNTIKVLYNPTLQYDNVTPWSNGTVGEGQNGWVLAKTESLGTTSQSNPPYSITGFSIEIPAGATYSIVCAGTSVRYMTLTSGAGVNTFSSNGVEVLTGDGYSWGGGNVPSTPINYPRGFVGGITFSYTPANSVDLAITSVDTLSYYTAIPISQASLVNTGAILKNNYGSDLTDVTLQAATLLNNVSQGSSSMTEPLLEAGASKAFSTGGFIPTQTGEYIVNYTASFNGTDDVPLNNVAADTIIYSDTIYSRDNGIPNGGLGIGAGNGGYLGQSFTINATTKLTSITANYTAGYTGERAAVAVFSMTNGVPDQLLGTTDTTIFADSNAVEITSSIHGGPLELTPGDYLIAAIEFESNVSLALNSEAYEYGTGWVNWPTSPFGTWANIDAFGVAFAKSFILRMNFGSTESIDITSSPASVCPGDTVKVSYTTSTVDPGNKFKVYLSDETGDFTNEVLVGSLTAEVDSTIKIIIPTTAVAGTNYRVRIKSTSPEIVSTASDYFTVNATPLVTIGTFDPICVDGFPVKLTSGSPLGGTYSGKGVDGFLFDPKVSGIGTHTITYSYTTTGCTGRATSTILVNPLPTVTLADLGTVCSTAPEFKLTAGSPAAGNYSGDGVSNNVFFPGDVTLGTHAITFTYTRPSTGCTNSITKNIEVIEGPTVEFDMDKGLFCTNGKAVSLVATPAGGSFYGDGVDGDMIFPSVAGAGKHMAHYVYTAQNGCTDTADYFFFVNTSPTVTLDPFASICRNAGTVKLSGGSPASGTYSGDGVVDGIFDPTSVAGSGSTIFYYYTDMNGCSGGTKRSITINDPTAVTLPSTTTFCEDQVVTLSGYSPAGLSFGGNGIDGNTFDATEAGVGNHKIKYSYTNEKSCVTVGSFNISVVAKPVAKVYYDVLSYCPGEGLALNVDNFDSFQWYKDGEAIADEENSSLYVTQPGTYNVYVSNGSQCADYSNSVVVTENSSPVPTIETTGPASFCQGGTVNLSTQAFESYSWKLNGNQIATTSSVNAGQTGSYTVTVTDANGCTGTSSAVNVGTNGPVTVTAIGSTGVCPGSSVTLRSSKAVSFQWYKDEVAINGATSRDHTTDQAGAYYVVAVDANGCEASSAEIEVTRYGTPPSPAVSVIGDLEFCFGLNNKLTAPVDYEKYQWYLNDAKIVGATFNSFINTKGGSFKVEVTDKNGCSTFSKVTEVVVNPLPAVTLNVSGMNEFCSPDSLVMFSGTTPGATYQWIRNNEAIAGATSYKYVATTTGLYQLTAKSDKGCEAASKLALVNAKAGVEKPVINNTDVNELTSSATDGNQWFKNGVLMTGETSQVLDITDNGVYSVVVTSGNGCSNSSDAFTVQNLSVEENAEEFSWVAYPNPVKDVLNITTTQSSSYSITDMQGRVVAVGEFVQGKNQLNVLDLAKGVYTLKGNDVAKNMVIRLIKE